MSQQLNLNELELCSVVFAKCLKAGFTCYLSLVNRLDDDEN